MKIGIIGTGAIGGTIAKKLITAGHNVKVHNTNKSEKLKLRADELGATPSTADAIAKDVDVVILSVPTLAIPNLSKLLFAGVSEDVIVVDTSNYYPFRDEEIKELQDGKVESVWVAEQLGRPVIKAFNNLLAHSLEYGGKPENLEGRIAMAISGDDEKAKVLISGLINDAGFDIVDAGDLTESWRHQPGTPAYCTELTVAELKQALADGVKENAPVLRDKAIVELSAMSSYPSHPDVVKFNRALFEKNPKTK
ncbi:NADPH-dependent F420 reductase [Algoriphagus sp. Y33]|uniref:NADPH-dependent F420 reductase n=1 Tax=Algoriphagus sp. Y33 TaxID=2772483 RepID=UPI00177DDC18|nr:NAD(P)-binding domain-containing protein [Algoriphagus sp. Y33]